MVKFDAVALDVESDGGDVSSRSPFAYSLVHVLHGVADAPNAVPVSSILGNSSSVI
jgi:hypothetical protein